MTVRLWLVGLLLKGSGFAVVRIVEKAGSQYIIRTDGTFYRIGKGTKKP